VVEVVLPQIILRVDVLGDQVVVVEAPHTILHLALEEVVYLNKEVMVVVLIFLDQYLHLDFHMVDNKHMEQVVVVEVQVKQAGARLFHYLDVVMLICGLKEVTVVV
jgi:hypothetical protein